MRHPLPHVKQQVLCGVIALWAGAATAQVELASVSSTGEQANDNTFGELSADGKFVLLRSQATNLVVPDANGTFWDVFVRDVAAAETSFACVNSSGQQSNGNSQHARISADGRFVLFSTHGSNMPGASGNITRTYLHDRITAETELVSQSTGGEPANAPSGVICVTPDGRFLTFSSQATNLIIDAYQPPQSFIRDRLSGETFILSIDSTGSPASSQAKFNIGPGGGNTSDDGRFGVFSNYYNDLMPGSELLWRKIYLHDRQTGETNLVSVPHEGDVLDGDCGQIPIISGDGRFVVFSSTASNLVANDTNGVQDIFVRDLLAHVTHRVSVSSTGEQANAACTLRAISPNGRFIAFNSSATNLDPNDANNFSDGFVHDLWTGSTEKVTFNWKGNEINAGAGVNGVSIDGRVVLIGSVGTNVIAQPVNGFLAQYLRERWKLGDVNRDGVVNVNDLLSVINAWGPCPNQNPPPPALPTPCDADITNDGTVNASDLLAVINNWG